RRVLLRSRYRPPATDRTRELTPPGPRRLQQQVNAARQLQTPRDRRRELAGTAGRWLLIAVDLHRRRRYLLLRRDLKADAADAKIFGSHSLDVGRGNGEVAVQIGVEAAGVGR